MNIINDLLKRKYVGRLAIILNQINNGHGDEKDYKFHRMAALYIAPEYQEKIRMYDALLDDAINKRLNAKQVVEVMNIK